MSLSRSGVRDSTGAVGEIGRPYLSGMSVVITFDKGANNATARGDLSELNRLKSKGGLGLEPNKSDADWMTSNRSSPSNPSSRLIEVVGPTDPGRRPAQSSNNLQILAI